MFGSLSQLSSLMEGSCQPGRNGREEQKRGSIAPHSCLSCAAFPPRSYQLPWPPAVPGLGPRHIRSGLPALCPTSGSQSTPGYDRSSSPYSRCHRLLLRLHSWVRLRLHRQCPRRRKPWSRPCPSLHPAPGPRPVTVLVPRL